MKFHLAFAALAARALSAHAQTPGGFSQEDMQKMMQGAQAMQACMQSIDQAAMQRMQAESEQLQAELKSLCAAGKRDEAQGKVMAFGMKAAKDPAIKAMAECSKPMQGMLPQQALAYTDAEHEFADRHVCDTQ